MKLGTLREGGRDGRLVVVSRDLAHAVRVPEIAATMQSALDDWANTHGRLASIYRLLNDNHLECCGEERAFALDHRMLAAPLPRAYQWVDGSAYLNHVALVRKARGAEMPPSYYTDPLMYQGASDVMMGPMDQIEALDEAHGIDLEAELAVITDDVPMSVSVAAAGRHIKLVTLVNDVSLRNLIPAELAKGFGFLNAKPATAMAPVAVTLDELGDAWRSNKLHGKLEVEINGAWFGAPDAGVGMNYDFAQLIAHAAKTRRLAAGTLIGSGTVSNADREAGSCCLAERRALETIEHGTPRTPFLRFGDRVRIDMRDAAGRSIFGAIDQIVERHNPT
jgi:fumarylacetoacetate (FAA) hydrolase